MKRNLPLTGQTVHTQDRRVELILNLIDQDPARQWELSEIAEMVNLSPGRLAHLFKSEISISIPQYLTQIRLTRARQELESSFLSIKEIAAAVGFRSVGRFAISFKTAVGTTPAEYRRRPTTWHSKSRTVAVARSANE
jgi:transcriptional regulator GlxA family with amidase domain